MLFVLGHKDVNFLCDDGQYDQNSSFVGKNNVDELSVDIPLATSLVLGIEESPLEHRLD